MKYTAVQPGKEARNKRSTVSGHNPVETGTLELRFVYGVLSYAVDLKWIFLEMRTGEQC